MNKKVKKAFSCVMLACVLGLLSLSAVKAADFWGDYDFCLDFNTGDPYDYSYALDKWKNEDAQVSSNSSSENDFTATVLPEGGYDGVPHDDVKVYPGQTATIEVPWYNKPRKAVLRGESNYDVIYSVSGFWMSDPSYVPHP